MALEDLIPDRRTFLKWTGIIGLAAMLPGNHSNSQEQESEWDFIRYRPPVYTNDEEIRRVCSALGPVIEFSPEDPRFDAQREVVLASCAESISAQNFTLSEEPTLERLNVEMFGTPLEQRIGEQFASYCQTALNYLSERVSGFPPLPFSSHIIQPGNQFRTGFNQQWFLTGGNHYICSLLINYPIVTAESEEMMWPCARTAYDQNRGSTVVQNRHGEYFVRLQAGEGSLRTPFSEGVPILTSNVDLEYSEQTGPIEARIANETFSEMVAQILSLELARELDIPGGTEDINKTYSALVEQSRDRFFYQHIPAALRWTEQNGLQAAFDLYLQSPGRFMQEIQ